jgi:hypothetical protein
MNYTNTLANNPSFNNSIQQYYFGSNIDIPQGASISENNLNQIRTMRSFLSLKENWDTYNAEKPAQEAIKKAISFSLWLSLRDVEIFFTAPTPDGDILIEVKDDNSNIEFVFSKDENDRVLAWSEGDFFTEAPLNDTTQVSYLKWLICPNGNCPDFR